MPKNNLYEEIIIAGFGGQGIISLGKLLAQAAMSAGKEVTYMPSYGAEVRGGTANCMIVIADEPVASPLVSSPDSLIAMNKASLNKFASHLKAGGLLLMNSSLIDEPPHLDKAIDILSLPADDIAIELGSPKIANMVALGAYLQKRPLFSLDVAIACLSDVLARYHHQLIKVNAEALKRGAEFAKSLPQNLKSCTPASSRK